MDGMKEKIAWVCKTKPAGTYDNWMQSFGEDFVPGYSAKGKRMIDMMM